MAADEVGLIAARPTSEEFDSASSSAISADRKLRIRLITEQVFLHQLDQLQPQAQ